MARAKGDGSDSSGRRRKAKPALKLVRIDPSGKSSMNLVFSGDGEERVWRLEQTSVIEFFALLLRGRMHRGRRVLLSDAELTFEPGEESDDDPRLCLSLGPLELCAPMDRADRRALKADIERSLKR